MKIVVISASPRKTANTQIIMKYVNEFVDKPDLETAKWLPRLDLKDVVYYEKWKDKGNLGWKEIQNMIQTKLD